MPLYFAYGSNMDRDAMAARCPASRPIGVARLERHRLALMREGYLTVVRDPRRAVHGLLWDLALADVPALDRYEEVAGGLYGKVYLSVVAESGGRRALVYVGTNEGPGRPRPEYLDGVIEAGRAAGLPATYLGEIAALAAGTGRVAAEIAPTAAAGDRPSIRPTRATPLDRPAPDRSAGWSWEP